MRPAVGARKVALFNTAPPAGRFVALHRESVRITEWSGAVGAAGWVATAGTKQSRNESGTCHLDEDGPGRAVFAVEGVACRAMCQMWDPGNLCQRVAFGMKGVGGGHHPGGQCVAGGSSRPDLCQMSGRHQVLDLKGSRCGG